MTEKLRYELDLAEVDTESRQHLSMRVVTDDDLEPLADLMLDAYLDTIDYDGESRDDAVDEVRDFLADERSLPDRSFAIDIDGRLVSAVLVTMVDDEPFIAYVMTAAHHKGRGLARSVTLTALRALAADGHRQAALYITDGNVASERLFESLGAVRSGS